MTGVHALIVAAGRGVRAGGGLPKQYRMLGGKAVLRHACEAFLRHPEVTGVQVVIASGDEEIYVAATAGLDLPPPVIGGATRQQSVLNGLLALSHSRPETVLIHDAARPLVPGAMIDRVLGALGEQPAALPVLPIVDSVRTGAETMQGEVPRDGLWRAQTPQGFRFQDILAAHQQATVAATDDAAIAHSAGLTVALVRGDEVAMKLTTADDFARAEALIPMKLQIGSGFDVHRFGPGDHVWLCGVRVPHDAGLVGHSDADVGLHALTDAVLGAIGDGDIGMHFSPSDPQWRGASSDRFLLHAARLVKDRGGIIDHVDLTIICEAPKIGLHRAAFVDRISALLAEHGASVSVKATTTEALGFTGRREGIAAQAIATVRMPTGEWR